VRYKILRLNKLPNWAIYRDLFNKFNFSFRYPVPFHYSIPIDFTFGGITYRDIMSDIDDVEVEVLPDDSLSQTRSFSTNLSSHFPPSANKLSFPPGIQVIDRCMVVENTPECLTKLGPHFNKVCFPKVLD